VTDRILYQLNLARMRFPYDDPRMESFRVWIEPLHALAEDARRTPGFFRRFLGELEPNGYIQVDPDDPLLMGNLTGWRSFEALKEFVYSGPHRVMLQNKDWWFEKWPEEDGPYQVLWWQDAEAPKPSVAQAMRRLELLKKHGDTPEAFGLAYAAREERNGEQDD